MPRGAPDHRVAEYEAAVEAARTPVAVLELLAQAREARAQPGDEPLEVVFAATELDAADALPAAVWVALRHGDTDASLAALLGASRTEFVVGEHEELDATYRLRTVEERRVLPDVGVLQMQMATMLDIPWDVIAMLCEWGPTDPRTEKEIDALLDGRLAAAGAGTGGGAASRPGRSGRLTMESAELAALLQLTAKQATLLATLVRQADVTITS